MLQQTIADLRAEIEELRRSVRPRGNEHSSSSQGPGSTRPKLAQLKPKPYANLPGENFLSWRSHFDTVARFNQWTPTEAKAAAYAFMSGTALETVMDIPLYDDKDDLQALLDKYQDRFLPQSRSQMLRAQFSFVVQLPNESVQKLHSRLRVLYQLAYPDEKDRSEVTLIEKFIQALNNRKVQNHVRRRKPTIYAEALHMAQEETSFVLMDAVTHAPGGPQQPMPGDNSFVGAIKGRGPNQRSPRSPNEERRCYYCGTAGHFKEKCPLRLQDLLKAKRNRKPNPSASDSNNKAPARVNQASRGVTVGSTPTKTWSPPEARQTPPIVTEGYRARQIAAIQEDQETPDSDQPELSEVLEDYDISTLDEATLATLYEALCEEEEEPADDPQDFPEGQ